MSLPRKIAYNVIVSSLTKIAGTGLSVFGIGLIARYLGTEGFGNYTVVMAFFSLFGALGDWGVYQLTTREISRPKADEKKIIANSAGIRIFISLLILLITPLLIFFLPYPESVKKAIFVVALSYIFSSSYQVFTGLFQKRLKMDRLTSIELIGKITQISFVFLAVSQNWGFLAIVSSVLINMIVVFLLVFFLSRRFVVFFPNFDFAYWKKFLLEAAPLGISALVTFIYFKADTILLSFFKPAQDVGIYGAAYKVIENIVFFPAMIVGLTMPLLSYSVTSDRKRFLSLINKNFKAFVILSLPLVIGTFFLADKIIAIIAGQDFPQSAGVLRIIIFALAFIFFGQLFNNILIVSGLQKKLLKVLVFCGLFNVLSNLIFIPHFSYLATAWISVTTEFLVIVLTGWIIFSQLKIIPRFRGLKAILLSSFFMAFFLYFFRHLNFIFLFFSSSALYLAGLWFFKALTEEELKSFFKKETVSIQTIEPINS